MRQGMTRTLTIAAAAVLAALTIGGTATAADVEASATPSTGALLEKRTGVGPDNCMEMYIYQGDQNYTRDIKVLHGCTGHRSISIVEAWEFDPSCQEAPGPRSLWFDEVSPRHGDAYYC